METIKKKIDVDLRWGREMTISGTQDFYGSGTILHDIIVDMSLYNFAVNLKVIFKNNICFFKAFNMAWGYIVMYVPPKKYVMEKQLLWLQQITQNLVCIFIPSSSVLRLNEN